jgi:hypothetical protein
MSPALPVWPPTFIATTAAPSPSPDARERWVVVDGSIRRNVDEREYLSELASCRRIEVIRYPHDSYVTHVCYR